MAGCLANSDKKKIMSEPKPKADDKQPETTTEHVAEQPEEFGGSNKPDPIRYGDWEVGGRCSDF